MINKYKLLPCPFCGNQPIGPMPGDTEWWIECEKCGITMEEDSRDYLISKWNKRKTICEEYKN